MRVPIHFESYSQPWMLLTHAICFDPCLQTTCSINCFKFWTSCSFVCQQPYAIQTPSIKFELSVTMLFWTKAKQFFFFYSSWACWSLLIDYLCWFYFNLNRLYEFIVKEIVFCKPACTHTFGTFFEEICSIGWYNIIVHCLASVYILFMLAWMSV